MASFIDMSLEDIIQKRRKENKRSKTKPQSGNPKSRLAPPAPPLRKLPIVDARNKIISKKRTQITDAREKLSQLAKHKDARLKLEQMRKQRNAKHQAKDRNIFNRNQLPFMRTVQNKERVFLDPSRQVHSQPLRARMTMNRQLTTKRNMEGRSFENRLIGLKTNKLSVNVSNRRSQKYNGNTRSAPLKPIVRTVENDIEMYDDPMDGDIDFEPSRVSLNRKASLQLKIIAHNNEPRESRSSIMHRSVPGEREREISPPRPPSILKKRPMAALRTEKKVEKPDKPNTEYRIIVSSLGSSVTAGDIEELFGDVGGMIESRLVRPGTAEVIYKTLEDAQKAVDLYHKRQLDGQPMNCLLVTPRSNAPTPRPGNKPGLYSTNSNVEPDLSTFHKVLFSNL